MALLTRLVSISILAGALALVIPLGAIRFAPADRLVKEPTLRVNHAVAQTGSVLQSPSHARAQSMTQTRSDVPLAAADHRSHSDSAIRRHASPAQSVERTDAAVSARGYHATAPPPVI